MNRGLRWAAGILAGDPHDPEARHPAFVKNSNYIAGADVGIESGEERSPQAHLARFHGLQKALALRVHSPDHHLEIGVRRISFGVVRTVKHTGRAPQLIRWSATDGVGKKI